MIDTQIAFDLPLLDRIQQQYRQAPQLVDEAIRMDIVPFARKHVDTTLRVEPGPASAAYPLRWTPSRHPEDRNKRPNTRYGYYSRQKAAFFATDGFGGGIPYRRRHKIVRGWHVLGDYRDGFGGIRITHDSRIALFVFGMWQQQYLMDIGWASFGDQIQVLSLDLNDRLALAVSRIGDVIASGGVVA